MLLVLFSTFDNGEKKLVRKMVMVGQWCIQMKLIDRPSMSKALEMFEGKVELLEMPLKPTLYSEEMSIENHMSNPIEEATTSSNFSIYTLENKQWDRTD